MHNMKSGLSRDTQVLVLNSLEHFRHDENEIVFWSDKTYKLMATGAAKLHVSELAP